MNQFNLTQAFKQLEKIVAEFESGEVDLEESIPKFKEGLDLAQKLKSRLSEIENQIIEIKDQFTTENQQTTIIVEEVDGANT